MKMYALVFQLASDIDPTLDGETLFPDKYKAVFPIMADRPKLAERLRGALGDEELSEASRAT
jgi:hypothetical protein